MVESKVRQAWQDYAEKHKDQVAEYHLLNQPLTINKNLITVLLTNPIEEPLLKDIKSDLVTYLRKRLKNSYIQVEGEMQQYSTKRKAYTNKEKFEYLVEKNPLLKELKDKLGLDPDY